MSRAHDQPSGKLAGPSGIRPPSTIVDPLSDVLRTVKLKGALFFLVDATSPWCIDVPEAAAFAGIILPRARHVVSYHIALEGSGLAGIPGAEPVAFEAGDIIVFPHADPYVMASAPDVDPEFTPAETLQFFRDLAGGRLPFVVQEGGGQSPRARFICGFLGCDLSPYNPMFASLPDLLHVRRPGDGQGDLLDQLVTLAMAEVRSDRAGSESILLGLSELMFVEVLRRHLETLCDDRACWLTGLRDPAVGRALALLHSAPSEDWTLRDLARLSGVSRSILAERFSRCVGETPMRYLALWRMQLAARMLTDGNEKILAIAEKVGFRSEAAFSRAFKKAAGASPASWRRQGKRPDGPPSPAARAP